MGIIVRRSMNERRKVEVRSKLFDKLRKQYLLVRSNLEGFGQGARDPAQVNCDLLSLPMAVWERLAEIVETSHHVADGPDSDLRACYALTAVEVSNRVVFLSALL